MRRSVLIVVAGGLLAGCVPASRTGPVVAAQRGAVVALADASAHDLAALRAVTGAVFEMRRAALVARLETGALGRVFDGETGPWLDRFAAAIDDAAARRALVEEREEVAAFDDAAAGALASLEARGAERAAIFADLLASTELLGVYAEAEGVAGALSAREVVAELYAQGLRGEIEDPEKRAAADRIVEMILGHGGAS